MSTQALTADALVLAAVTYVSNGTALDLKAILDDDFTAGSVVRFQATSTGRIIVEDAYGHRLGIVAPLDTGIAYARAANSWEFSDSVGAPSANVADVSADGATAWAAINALLACVKRAGLMKAE